MPLWSATEPSCGSDSPSATRDVGDVADDVDAGTAGERQIGAGVDSPTVALSQAAVGGEQRPP